MVDTLMKEIEGLVDLAILDHFEGHGERWIIGTVQFCSELVDVPERVDGATCRDAMRRTVMRRDIGNRPALMVRRLFHKHIKFDFQESE